MKSGMIVLALLLFSQIGFADDIVVGLSHANVNLQDVKSLERGAKTFATVCMACHTLIYMRYDPIAKNAGITLERMPINIKKWPFDVKPPDLSLEVSHRGADWIYTYLHSFYVDKTRPTGFNNLVYPNTAMTDIVLPWQGMQTKIPEKTATLYHKPQWDELLEPGTKGSMTPEQFDTTVRDVVNFLAYASTPYLVRQQQIGYWVIVFLIILFVLCYLLKRAYWKDLKERKKS